MMTSSGGWPASKVGGDVAHGGGGRQQDRRLAEAQALGAQPDLLDGLLAGDVDRPGGPGEAPRAAATCSSRVDLPMPGSPPIRRAEPGTSPPPITRSNSAMPVGRRSAGALSPSRGWRSILRPRPADRPLGALSAAASSTMVFHAPQASQRPLQRGWLAPQVWQTIAAPRAFARPTATSTGMEIGPSARPWMNCST